MKVKYRFIIKDVNGSNITGYANCFLIIKLIVRHFDFKQEVVIKNNITGRTTIWRYL